MNKERREEALQLLVNSDLAMLALFELLTEANPLPEIEGSDEIVGQKYRAYVQAKEMITHAFAELESYQKLSKPVQNGARHI